jgi:hypothetical protein
MLIRPDPSSYIINWISFFIQKPGSKIETALNIIGEQVPDTNKFFTDVISELFGRYANQMKSKLAILWIDLIVRLRIITCSFELNLKALVI